jgi:hypothetical protein
MVQTRHRGLLPGRPDHHPLVTNRKVGWALRLPPSCYQDRRETDSRKVGRKFLLLTRFQPGFGKERIIRFLLGGLGSPSGIGRSRPAELTDRHP